MELLLNTERRRRLAELKIIPGRLFGSCSWHEWVFFLNGWKVQPSGIIAGFDGRLRRVSPLSTTGTQSHRIESSVKWCSARWDPSGCGLSLLHTYAVHWNKFLLLFHRRHFPSAATFPLLLLAQVWIIFHFTTSNAVLPINRWQSGDLRWECLHLKLVAAGILYLRSRKVLAHRHDLKLVEATIHRKCTRRDCWSWLVLR